MSSVREWLEAATKGDIKSLKKIHSSGIDINANEKGFTALHCAAYKNRMNVLKYLIKSGADLDVSEEIDGATPLYLATQENHISAMKELIKSGADIQKGAYGDVTPLHKACVKQNVSAVSILVKAGANVNALDSRGRSPLDVSSNIDIQDLLKGKKSGCYIATAVYGDYNDPRVVELRKYRDEILLNTVLGRLFIGAYNLFGPTIAQALKNRYVINGMVKYVLNRIVSVIRHFTR